MEGQKEAATFIVFYLMNAEYSMYVVYIKDGEKISDTQRYKCCGNAVTTNVITAIVDEMFDEVKE